MASENPQEMYTPPTEGIVISWEVGGSIRPKNFKKYMKLNWNFQRGGGVLENIPPVREVWKFSEITQWILIKMVNLILGEYP